MAATSSGNSIGIFRHVIAVLVEWMIRHVIAQIVFGGIFEADEQPVRAADAVIADAVIIVVSHEIHALIPRYHRNLQQMSDTALRMPLVAPALRVLAGGINVLRHTAAAVLQRT